MRNLICNRLFFNFSSIKSLEDEIKIEIYDKDTIGSDDLEGVVKIKMDELKH